MTATRPVTSLNLHCAPPWAKPADHHDTTQRDGVFERRTKKKNSAPPPNGTSRTRIIRHNASDVRGEGGGLSRRVHWAWRGRDSPAPQEHGGELGSFFFSPIAECGGRATPPPSTTTRRKCERRAVRWPSRLALGAASAISWLEWNSRRFFTFYIYIYIYIFIFIFIR